MYSDLSVCMYSVCGSCSCYGDLAGRAQRGRFDFLKLVLYAEIEVV